MHRRSDAMTRRAFLTATSAAAMAAAATSRMTLGAAAEPTAPPVCVFSKHLEHLDYEDLARTCRELGLDGVDLTVRGGGHVEPAHVETDLPRAVEAIRAEGLDVPMITTRLLDGDDPTARPILTVAAEQGIGCFRCGWYRYDETTHPMEQVRAFTERLAGLTKVAEECGIAGAYHNHSSMRDVGGPLWDLYLMVAEIDSPYMGASFDVGHAKADGGAGAWPTNTRLLAPYTQALAVKDVRWHEGRVQWVPLGDGWVDLTASLRIFHDSGFNGPISLHFEYPTESREVLLEHMADANAKLRQAMADAGYPAS